MIACSTDSHETVGNGSEDVISFCIRAHYETENCHARETYTVRLDKMAQHARLWALFMAKLKGQSQNASNMALGKCIGLQHIQISAS